MALQHFLQRRRHGRADQPISFAAESGEVVTIVEGDHDGDRLMIALIKDCLACFGPEMSIDKGEIRPLPPDQFKSGGAVACRTEHRMSECHECLLQEPGLLGIVLDDQDA